MGVRGPLLLIVLDGIGLYKNRSEGYPGNALDWARTPTLDRLMVRENLFMRLKAHGTAVGMPSDQDMGNSEVGHNAIGAGRIFEQGAKLVNESLRSRSLFQGETWQKFIGSPEKPGHILEKQHSGNGHAGPAVHLIGLLSDGNVHSHINHLFALIDECDRVGVRKLFVHTLLDGRDVEEVSAERYINQLEAKLSEYRRRGRYYHIASGGGRMVITMDRYEANWEWVRLGWETHVLGQGRLFPDALTAINTYRSERKGVIDQDLPPFVIQAESGGPIGPIRDQDIVLFFNFRGDRAIEISRAFTEKNFDGFQRESMPEVLYAGMMEYDGDLHIPEYYLVDPPAIDRTISEYLVNNDVTQFALAETQKFGHMTYFWNGNNSVKFSEQLETWVEISSDQIPFEYAPQMKAVQVTDALIEALLSHRYKFLRVNYANGDMVGHTGDLAAAVQAVETVDRCLHSILAVSDRLDGTVIITADHGNCDQMLEIDKKTGQVRYDQAGLPMAKTSHTLSPVPFLIHGPDTHLFQVNRTINQPGLANIAATLCLLLGFQPPSLYEPPLIEFRQS